MERAIEPQIFSEKCIKQGMLWISGILESTARDLHIQIERWTWQSEASKENELYSLAVSGARHKRAVKLFSNREISECLTNMELQEEIRQRLTKLLIFLGPNQ